MSVRQVLRTTKAALEDETTGLAAQALALATLDQVDGIRTDFNFVAWRLSGKLHPSGGPNVMVTPQALGTNLKLPGTPLRAGAHQVQIGYEIVDVDLTVLQDNVAVVAAAVLKVLDRLREFSDANGGTVFLVQEPVSFSFGDFGGGPVTTSGFLASVTILERSTQ